MPSLLDSALGWMQDPRRTQQLQGVGRAIQSGLLNIEQSDKRFQDLFDKSFGDPKNPFKVTDKKALSQLAEMTQGGLLGMAEVGMFVGAGSKAFDKAMAFTASKMEKKGLSPQEIWKETGTVRGPDGQWRQEISDADAKFVTSAEMLDKAALLKQGIAENKQKIKESKEYPDLFPKELSKAQKALREENKANKELVDTYQYNQAFTGSPANLALEHPELYKAYPDLADVRVMQGTYNPSYLGSFSPKYNVLEITEKGLNYDPRSTALHEMQHAIQEQEGFGVGGNVDTMARLRSTVMNKIGDLNSQMGSYVKAMDASTDPLEKAALKQQYDAAMEERMKLVPFAQLEPFDAYRALMGEAEARLTQTRRDLTPEQRKQFFPFEFQDKNLNPYGLDVPPNMLIHLDQAGRLIEKGLLGQ